jgi:hypothetical protein
MHVIVARSVLSAVVFVAANTASAQQRIPSEALHDIVKGRLENIRWTPVQVESALKPVLQNVRTAGLAPDEEIALALAYFFTFDGLSAKPLFEKHMNRDDALGRVSWQSLQQMSFFGAKDYALVEQRTKDYRRKFPPSADDTEYTFNMVNNLSRLAATGGDHARAVALVLEDVAAIPLEIPFRSFDLLGQRYPSFQATGRSDDALTWMRKHRDALKAAQAVDTGQTRGSLSDSLQIPHRPGVLHLTPFVDRLLPDDPRWTRAGAVRFQRAQAIQKFDAWIAALERGETLPPSS